MVYPSNYNAYGQNIAVASMVAHPGYPNQPNMMIHPQQMTNLAVYPAPIGPGVHVIYPNDDHLPMQQHEPQFNYQSDASTQNAQNEKEKNNKKGLFGNVANKIGGFFKKK